METLDPDQKIEIFKKFKLGDLHFAQKLLSDRVISPNLCDDLQISLLHFMSVNNYLQIAELLLNSGANPNLPGGTFQETPLHW
jgi:ankyrin repeat protein